MYNWDDLRFFLALAKHGTQKAAATHLKVDQATVGRRIRDFEEKLRTKLFDKTSEQYLLSEAGKQVHKVALEVEELCHSVERRVAGADEDLSGVVKMAMPGALANHWLIPRLAPFLKKYPQISFEFLTGPEVINLWKREADVALRLVKPTQSELFSKKLGEISLGLYGAKKLLTKREQEILSLPFVGLSPAAMSEAERELLERIGEFSHRVCTSAAWSNVFYALDAGLGVGVLPSFLAQRSGHLKLVDDFPMTKATVWLVMHPDVKQSGRLKVLVSFLTEAFRQV